MFKADCSVKSVLDIDYTKFPNLKVVLFDIDNTLVAHYSNDADENIKKYINNLHNLGYQVYLCSNASTMRIQHIASILGTRYLERAGKPSIKILDEFMKNMRLNKEEVLIVGDQIFTDVLCGKKAGIHTVLVEPISDDEPWYIKIKRIPEIFIRKL